MGSGDSVIRVHDEDRIGRHSAAVLCEIATLILTDEGSVDVLGEDRYTLGAFDVPWAVDAIGADVPTRFEIDGNTITQIIETDATTA